MAIDVDSDDRRLGPTAVLTRLGAVGWVLAAVAAYYGFVVKTGQMEQREAENQRLIQDLSQQRQSVARAAELQQQADAAQSALDQAMADRAEVAQLLASTQAEVQLAQQTLTRVKSDVQEQRDRLAALQDKAGRGEPPAAPAKAAIQDL